MPTLNRSFVREWEQSTGKTFSPPPGYSIVEDSTEVPSAPTPVAAAPAPPPAEPVASRALKNILSLGGQKAQEEAQRGSPVAENLLRGFMPLAKVASAGGGPTLVEAGRSRDPLHGTRTEQLMGGGFSNAPAPEHTDETDLRGPQPGVISDTIAGTEYDLRHFGENLPHLPGRDARPAAWLARNFVTTPIADVIASLSEPWRATEAVNPESRRDPEGFAGKAVNAAMTLVPAAESLLRKPNPAEAAAAVKEVLAGKKPPVPEVTPAARATVSEVPVPEAPPVPKEDPLTTMYFEDPPFPEHFEERPKVPPSRPLDVSPPTSNLVDDVRNPNPPKVVLNEVPLQFGGEAPKPADVELPMKQVPPPPAARPPRVKLPPPRGVAPKPEPEFRVPPQMMEPPPAPVTDVPVHQAPPPPTPAETVKEIIAKPKAAAPPEPAPAPPPQAPPPPPPPAQAAPPAPPPPPVPESVPPPPGGKPLSITWERLRRTKDPRFPQEVHDIWNNPADPRRKMYEVPDRQSAQEAGERAKYYIDNGADIETIEAMYHSMDPNESAVGQSGIRKWVTKLAEEGRSAEAEALSAKYASAPARSSRLLDEWKELMPHGQPTETGDQAAHLNSVHSTIVDNIRSLDIPLEQKAALEKEATAILEETRKKLFEPSAHVAPEDAAATVKKVVGKGKKPPKASQEQGPPTLEGVVRSAVDKRVASGSPGKAPSVIDRIKGLVTRKMSPAYPNTKNVPLSPEIRARAVDEMVAYLRSNPDTAGIADAVEQVGKNRAARVTKVPTTPLAEGDTKGLAERAVRRATEGKPAGKPATENQKIAGTIRGLLDKGLPKTKGAPLSPEIKQQALRDLLAELRKRPATEGWADAVERVVVGRDQEAALRADTAIEDKILRESERRTEDAARAAAKAERDVEIAMQRGDKQMEREARAEAKRLRELEVAEREAYREQARIGSNRYDPSTQPWDKPGTPSTYSAPGGEGPGQPLLVPKTLSERMAIHHEGHYRLAELVMKHPDLLSRINEHDYAAMLLSPAMAGRNLLTSLGIAAKRNTVQSVVAAGDAIKTAATGRPRQIATPEIVQGAKGYWEGLKQQGRLIRTGKSGSIFSPDMPSSFDPKYAKTRPGKVLNKLFEFESRASKAAVIDSAISGGSYRKQLAEAAQLRGIKTDTKMSLVQLERLVGEEAQKQAFAAATGAGIHQPGTMGEEISTALPRMADAIAHKYIHPRFSPGRIMDPFAPMTGRLAQKSVDMMGGDLLSGLRGMAKGVPGSGKKALLGGGEALMSGAEYKKGYELGKRGLYSGDYEDSQTQEGRFLHVPPNSVNITAWREGRDSSDFRDGDEWVPINALGPVGVPFVLGATQGRGDAGLSPKRGVLGMIAAGVGQTFGSFSDSSMGRFAKDIMYHPDEPSIAFGNFAQSLPAREIPQAMKSVTYDISNKRLDNRGGIVERTLNKTKQALGLDAPGQIDVLTGEEQETRRGKRTILGSAASALISPIRPTAYHGTEAETAIQKLIRSTPAKDRNLPTPTGKSAEVYDIGEQDGKDLPTPKKDTRLEFTLEQARQRDILMGKMNKEVYVPMLLAGVPEKWRGDTKKEEAWRNLLAKTEGQIKNQASAAVLGSERVFSNPGEAKANAFVYTIGGGGFKKKVHLDELIAKIQKEQEASR